MRISREAEGVYLDQRCAGRLQERACLSDLRVATERKACALLDQVVRLLRVGNRIPTPKMIEVPVHEAISACLSIH